MSLTFWDVAAIALGVWFLYIALDVAIRILATILRGLAREFKAPKDSRLIQRA